ncbi:MAG TPA: ABC transporter substrate-binding protein [Nonomuraea sp.]|nr:ABC transporter substrate-binding protein [Nonomuraea sp.]
MKRKTIVVTMLSALLLTGCGTRMSSERIEAADGGGGTVPVAAGAPVQVPGAIAPAAPIAGGSAPGAVAVAPGATPAAQPGVVPGKPGKAAQPATPGGPAGTTPAACTRVLEPLVLGQTAPSSGIIGATHANLRSGLALWVRAVNARGGLQCHPVQMFQMDDGADPARVVSNLTDLVKTKKAVAIVGIGIPTTLPAAKKFAEQNKIPFIGGDLTEPAWFGSPWLFPQGGSSLAEYAGAIKAAVDSVKATKVGLVYCVEASICGTINANFEAMAKSAGVQVVLRKVASITATDYTSECQSMKAAGAEVVFYGLDGSGAGRMARSCRSLGYNHPVAAAALAVSGPASEDQYLQAQGVFLGTATAPFRANDTAGAREFQQAYAAYAQGSSIDQNSMNAWASGKLLEAALGKVAEQARSGPITTAVILDGLAKIRNETLGGLAPGLTFNRDAPPGRTDCFYTLTITKDGYQAPKGSAKECLSGLPSGI